jgi:hypothetical protein
MKYCSSPVRVVFQTCSIRLDHRNNVWRRVQIVSYVDAEVGVMSNYDENAAEIKSICDALLSYSMERLLRN